MMKYELYQVGGAVRDRLLGLESKDIDYTVVVTSDDSGVDAAIAFNWFHAEIVREGYDVYLCTLDVFTIRAKFPKTHVHAGLVADFVLARKESGFAEGTRRPLRVELGTLEDDLRRRDFTVNAIAMDSAGNLIDPFYGLDDLQIKILRCPIDAETSFNDDPLRILRALRFSVTKDFRLHFYLKDAIRAFNVNRFKETVSTERVREELYKMFRHDTLKTLDALYELRQWNDGLYVYIFEQLWLKPTNEVK